MSINNQSDFEPLFLMSSGHIQTIFGSLFNLQLPLYSQTELVKLSDGDHMSIEMSTPKHWKKTNPTIVMVHGLCGSHKSNYLIRLARKFKNKSYRVARVNLRGSGSSRGFAKAAYHCGSSEDLYVTIKYIKEKAPESPLILIGFSLGGNIVLKLAGELGDKAKGILEKIIAVSPPADLKECVKMINHPDNQFYERYFIKLLRSEIHYRHTKFKLPKIFLPATMTLFEFDEYYMAPRIGYKSALEYYEACSAKKFVQDISIPCKILFSKDDPIIDHTVLEDESLPSHVTVVKTNHGGHLGYLSNPIKKKVFRWMDKILMDWVEGYFKEKN